MWRLVNLLFWRAAPLDSDQAFHTMELLYAKNLEEIMHWWRCLEEYKYDDGRYDYSQVTFEQLADSRDLRMSLSEQIKELSTTDRWVGPFERDQVRLFLLSLPWLVFPKLSDQTIRFFGINYVEREQRLMVTSDVDDQEFGAYSSGDADECFQEDN